MSRSPWAKFSEKGKCKHGHFPSSCVECAKEAIAAQTRQAMQPGVVDPYATIDPSHIVFSTHAVWGSTIIASSGTPKPASIETSVTEIIGMRSWYLVPDADGLPMLRSFHFENRWEGPRLVADKVPTLENEHGIYGMKGWPTASHPINAGYFSTVPITGTVSLSGTVVCGEYGYRGEQAMVRSLRLHGVAWRLEEWKGHHPAHAARYAATVEAVRSLPPLSVVAALEARYGCEVEWMGDENVFAEEPKQAKTGLKAQGY